jgi:hypothetical protein
MPSPGTGVAGRGGPPDRPGEVKSRTGQDRYDRSAPALAGVAGESRPRCRKPSGRRFPRPPLRGGASSSASDPWTAAGPPSLRMATPDDPCAAMPLPGSPATWRRQSPLSGSPRSAPRHSAALPSPMAEAAAPPPLAPTAAAAAIARASGCRITFSLFALAPATSTCFLRVLRLSVRVLQHLVLVPQHHA